MSAHQAEFQARLARIQAGKGFTKTTVYVGMDTAFTYLPQGRRKAGMAQVAGNMGLALGFPMAMAVGFLSFGLERYFAFVLGGQPDPRASIDIEMLKMAATAFGIAVVASHLMGLRDRGLLVAKAIGVAGGMLFFHNLVHIWPQVFERMFSSLWVAKVLAETQPHSLLWRGVCFPF
jgi:hypothetical protein